ncbi:MAG: hypothetical protein K6T29_01265 [Peptococcaceae bacterium]|nr:hypothetical protein [Peptococcaceae bacterium]
MAYRPIVSGDVALAFLGENIPAIGPRFKSRDEAVKAARRYLEDIDRLAGQTRETPVQIVLKRQADGRYSLVVEGSRQTVERLNNLDELLLKRFRKGLKKLFILTCFVEGADGLECLVLTEGLGAVFYAPGIIKGRRP